MEMVEENPFKDISKKIKTIKLGDKELKVKPKVKDVEAFLLIKKDMDEKDTEKITTILKGVIRRAHDKDELSDEDIEEIVTLNYGKLINEMTILFGFTTREEVEKAKKDFTKTLKT
jgi:hypothetical protein